MFCAILLRMIEFSKILFDLEIVIIFCASLQAHIKNTHFNVQEILCLFVKSDGQEKDLDLFCMHKIYFFSSKCLTICMPIK